MESDSFEALALTRDALVVKGRENVTSFALNRRTRCRILLTNTEAALLKGLCESSEAAKVSTLMRTHMPQFTARLLETEIITLAKSHTANPSPHLFAMLTTVERFFIELTSTCDLRCRHCFGAFGPAARTDLPMATMKRVIREGRALGVYRIDITGGEPTMHPSFDEMIIAIGNAGFVSTLFSNLTHLASRNLAALAAHPPLHVTTSIESLQAKVHDGFRGQKGSLQRTISNIRKLRELSIPVQVNLVVGTHNYGHVRQTIDWLKSEDLPIIVDTVRLEGRATRDLLLNKAQARGLAELLAEEFPSQPTPGMCGVGRSMVYISSSGVVRLCPSLSGSAYELANLSGESPGVTLQHVLDSLPKQYSGFRNRPCRDGCLAADRCDGGCPAHALFWTGSPQGPDPNMCMRFEGVQACSPKSTLLTQIPKRKR